MTVVVYNQQSVLLVRVVLVADAGLQQKVFLIALAQRFLCQSTAVGTVEAQLELAHDVVAEPTAAEILHADGYAVGGVVHEVLEIRGSPLIHDEHTLALALLALLIVGEFALLYLDVILACEPSQRLGIGHLLVLHDEANGVAALAASEAMAGAACRRHIERRGLLVVKRA